MNYRCCGKGKRMVLLYSCSGGANVAEISDKAARQLMLAGEGTMFCLAGLGAGIEGMIQIAKDADVNLIIDGCPTDCGKKIFERHCINKYVQIKVTDLGIEKARGASCSQKQVDKVLAKARQILAGQE